MIGGVMIGYICSAVTDFVVTFADDSNIVNLHNWSMGSFSGMSWDNISVMSAVVFVSLAITFLMSKPIGAYQLGEVYARNMGVNIKLFRVQLILLSSILSACVTAFCRSDLLCGIAVPHLIKSLLKTAKPILVIPACFLGGAVFCLFCDMIARTVFAPHRAVHQLRDSDLRRASRHLCDVRAKIKPCENGLMSMRLLADARDNRGEFFLWTISIFIQTT